MSVWKRNAVVLAIVMFVGVAVYLNWSYNNQLTGENSGENGDGKVLGQTTLVNGVEEESEGETVDGQVDDSDASGYFASARLNRQQARDSALELLQEAAADEKAEQTVVDEANASIQTMASVTVSEAQIENLVTAKGYADCVAFIGDNSVSVVVSNNGLGLTDADVAKITEIVTDETGMEASQIKIIEATEE